MAQERNRAVLKFLDGETNRLVANFENPKRNEFTGKNEFG